MGQVPTVMVSLHFILSDVEMDRMAETQTMVSHCPYSNVNLSSGIAPIRKLMKRNIPIGWAPISLVVILYRWRRFLRKLLDYLK